jgi:hypothetical protein
MKFRRAVNGEVLNFTWSQRRQFHTQHRSRIKLCGSDDHRNADYCNTEYCNVAMLTNGMPDCPASIQSGTGLRKTNDAGTNLVPE